MLRQFLLGLLIISSQSSAQVPSPKEMIAGEGTMTINFDTRIIAPKSLENEAVILTQALGRLTGLHHRSHSPELENRFTKKVILRIDSSLSKSEYALSINPDAALIRGQNGEAILHGIQTFSQILPCETLPQQSVKIPCLTIKDAPASERRIVFIDTARHLFPIKTLKSLLTWMSYHKLNELHLHFNDDQGWRLESKKFPKLTGVGSVRPSTPPYTDHEDDENFEDYGGYYSRENIEEFLAHASRFHIKVIPGFSLPTHASSLLAAYPELGNDDLPDYKPVVQSTWGVFPDTLAPKPETFTFLNTLLSEVAAQFPADEIRIHAPDVPWTEWQKSPRAQAYLKAHKLASPAALRNHFLEKIDTILATHKRKRFDPTSVPAIDLSTYQRPPELELNEDPTREAATPMVSLSEVYQFSKTPAVQATIWSSLVHDEEKLIYQLFPRMAGFAEAAWSAPAPGEFAKFLTKLQPVLEFYEKADLEIAELYLPQKREALLGTKVSTKINHAGDHWPELAFDGNLDSYFQSLGPLKKDDHLTFEFAFPVSGKITIATGGEKKGTLENGSLESSIDGKKWSKPSSFVNGVAATTLPEGSRYLRFVVTSAQAGSLVLSEIKLEEPLLPPVVHDARFTEFPQVDAAGVALRAQLSFEADFSKHPELRPQIRAIRKRFFQSSPRIMQMAGLIGRQDSIHLKVALGEETQAQENTLTIEPAELAKLSPVDAEDFLLKHLVGQLQQFPDKTPQWFVTGITDLIRQQEVPDSTWAGNLPKNLNRSNALAGGPDSAAFLKWLTSTHSEVPLRTVSISFRKGINNDLIWRASTENKTLKELVQDYQN